MSLSKEIEFYWPNLVTDLASSVYYKHAVVYNLTEW